MSEKKRVTYAHIKNVDKDYVFQRKLAEAKIRARSRADSKAKRLLMLQHYTEYLKNFNEFYSEEIKKIQGGKK